MTAATLRSSAFEAARTLLTRPDAAGLAIIVGVDGPSYRPLGTMAAVFEDGTQVGSLSSGCIDADVRRHAVEAQLEGRARLLRYGAGSPFRDILLPCGGGLDILVIPRPDRSVLAGVAECLADRRPASIEVDIDSGSIRPGDGQEASAIGRKVRVAFEPDVQFVVFGMGPEAGTFSSLAQSAGYASVLLSSDETARTLASTSGCTTRPLVSDEFPEDLLVDASTGIVLFFHDHARETAILGGALSTPAFYIGAQGSRRVHEARLTALRDLGLSEAQLSRVHGPVGLIPSARDPGTLAVSVLAEALTKAMASCR